MTEENEKRAPVVVVDELNLKHEDISALLDIMSACDREECDVNAAASAIQRLVVDAKTLANELYHASYGGAS